MEMDTAAEGAIWKILMIDDDEDDFLIARNLLACAKRGTYVLEWANTFEAGRQALKNQTYDAVLMDYDLGAHTGLELAREVITNGYQTPIILFTGRGSYELDIEAMQSGTSLYLTKGETSALMLERGIRYAIERKQDERALALANRALAEANETLRQQKLELDRRLQERSDLLESIQDGFFSINRDWVFTYLNRRAAEQGDIEPEDLVGKNIWKDFPGLIGTAYETNYRRAMDERISLQFETQSLSKDIWYSISVYPSVEGISVFWQDISQRKRAEARLKERDRDLREGQELLRSAVENLPGIFVIYDADRRAEFINSHGIQVSGRQASELIGKQDEELWPDSITSQYLPALLEAYRTGTTQRCDISVVMPHGVSLDLANTFVPIVDELGKVQRCLSIAVEMSGIHQSQKALQASEARFRNLFEAMREAFFLVKVIYDENGELVDYQFLELNTACESMVGCKREELIGKTLRGMYPQADWEYWQHTFGQVAKSREPAHLEYESKRLGRSYEIFAYAPEPGQCAAIFNDVTARKQTEILNTALSDINHRLYSTHDFEEVMQEAVTASAKALGCETAAISLHKDDQWVVSYVHGFPPDVIGAQMNDEEEKHAVLAIQTRQPVAINDAFNDERVNRAHMRKWGIHSVLVVPILLRDEAVGVMFFNYQSSIFKFENFHIQFAVNLASSISLALENAHLFGSLQNEIAERKHAESSLGEYSRQLEQSNQELESFAFIASHDLREPLRKIASFGERLNATAGPALGETERDYLARMQQAAVRMSKMIEDLLALSRVTSEGKPFIDVDLNLVARLVLEDLDTRIRQSGGKVELGNLPTLQADPTQMQQLLQNLISNGLKFCKPNQAPIVRVQAKKLPHQWVEISVEDNGIGFEMEKATSLLQPFQRLHGRSEYEGTGIGLSICRKIVERHGGKITFHSQPGEGATFTVQLPCLH